MNQPKKKNKFKTILVIIVVLAVISFLPPIRERISVRLANLRTSLAYALFPPEKEVFVPKGETTSAAQKSVVALTPSATPLPSATATVLPPTPEFTSTPAPTPTPLPTSVTLSGMTYVSQHYGWNNCGPANLNMLLSYWGWTGKMLDMAKVLKPFDEDKNVMPYEMLDYITNDTELGGVLRYGGTLDVIKNLLSNGFPVILETGTYTIRETLTGKYSWMGHYATLTGYDDATGEFIVQDSYVGENQRVKYDLIESEWRSFNNVFLVAYSKDKENDVLNLLGDYADYNASLQIAADKASEEVNSLADENKVFAWFNRGSSLVLKQDYFGGAEAYDQAFKLMAELPELKRPFRFMWYQTGPYFAYYYAGRYQDVIDLATKTLEPVERSGKPYLEESYYWRARAEIAVGLKDVAIQDLCTSLKYHPEFNPPTAELQSLGATCP